MQITQSTVKKLTITGAKNLDPITVMLEDIGPRRGKVIVECYGKAWSAYWGSCGDKGVAAFMLSCNEDYIANCFVPGIEGSKYDPQQAADELKKVVIARRRQCSNWYSGKQNWNYDSLDKDAARELWELIEGAHFYDDPAGNSELIRAVTGHDEWWLCLPESPNPEYQYLCRIIKAVQEALRMALTLPGTTNADSPFQPGEVIDYCGEIVTVVANHGNTGTVTDGSGAVIAPFYWIFEGAECRRVEKVPA